jgi:hypothetical protein
LNLSNEEIIEYINQLEKDSRAIKNEGIKISWYMRGGISYDDAMMLSHFEREMISSLIKENMETTKESGLPFF